MHNKRLPLIVLFAAGMVLWMVDASPGYVTTDDALTSSSRRYEADVVPAIVAPPLHYRLVDGAFCTFWYDGGHEGTQEEVEWCMDDVGPPNGIPVFANSSWAVWYYQGHLTHEGLTSVARLPMEKAPLYLSEWDVIHSYGGSLPLAAPPTYWADFKPITGLDHLKNIPLECTNADAPVVASARYRIVVGGDKTPPVPVGDDILSVDSSAAFFITATYDETLFDVTIAGQARFCYNVDDWTGLTYGSVWLYARNYPLRAGVPLLFTGQDYSTYGTEDPISGAPVGKLDFYWQIPEYVTVRLKPNRRLDELNGRTVKLMLHTANQGHCPTNLYYICGGDTLHYERTGYVEVGAQEEVPDWYIPPPPLKDECIPPSFDKMDQKAAEADTIGTRVVSNLNVDLPSMRVGHNRFRVGHTLSETLGNEACYEAFWTKVHYPVAEGFPIDDPAGGWIDFSFVRVNVQGVWCALDDVPGWYSTWDVDPAHGKRLNVYDAYSNLVYRFLTDKKAGSGALNESDYAFRTAKLVEVDEASTGDMVRTYEYAEDVHRTVLEIQRDRNNNEIAYSFNSGTHQLTVTGNGTRTINATFASTSASGDPGACSLLGASCGAGDAWRQYEWNPMNDPMGPSDGKLKSVKDGAGNYLAYLQYEPCDGETHKYSKGRLIKWTRGSAGQPEQELIAEYSWTDPVYTLDGSAPASLPALQNTTMNAKFYMNDYPTGQYELIERTFDPNGAVIRIVQHSLLHPIQTGEDIPSVITYDRKVHFAQDPDGDGDGPAIVFPAQPKGDPYWDITTLPSAGGQMAHFAYRDPAQGDNLVETFFGPPPTVGEDGRKSPPAVEQRRNWFSYHYKDRLDNAHIWGVWKKDSKTDHSRGDAETSYEYDAKGFLLAQIDPDVTMADGQVVHAEQGRSYEETGDPEFANDYRHISGVTVNNISTTYAYDATPNYGYPTGKTEADGNGHSRTCGYGFDVFGQLVKEVDYDGYVHWKDFDPVTGLLTGTCTSEDKGAITSETGNVVRQTQYTYINGMLSTISVADNPGPFPKGNPAAWIVTTLGYDDYGRLTSKTVGGHTTYYDYDGQDRLAIVSWHDGRWKEITRNGRGQITRIDYHGTGVETLTSTYTYDALGNLTCRTTEGCSKCGKSTTYSYEPGTSLRTAETRTEVTP